MPKSLTQNSICVRDDGAANVRPVLYLRTFVIKNASKPGSIDSLIMMNNALIWWTTTQKTKTNLRSIDASLKKKTLTTTKSMPGGVKMNACKKKCESWLGTPSRIYTTQP